MSTLLAFDVSTYVPGIKHPPHQHDELQLSIVLRGNVSETVGTCIEYGSALSVVAKDSGVVHADNFGSSGAKLARLVLPFGVLAQLVDDHTRSLEWRWTHNPRVAFPFLKLVQRAHRDCLRSFAANDPDTLDFLAAFTARPVRTRGEPPRWLEETMNELRHSWRPGLRVADIARNAGVHPVYLARCVRRWYGHGVADELRQLRIRSATTALTQSHETVSRIAHRSGYSDEPHLCRELHQTLGMTPRRYRSLVSDLS